MILMTVIYPDVVSPPLFATSLWERQVYVLWAMMFLHCKIRFLHKCAPVSSKPPWVMDLFHLSLLLAIRPLPSQELPRAVTHFKTIYSYNCAVKNAVKGGSNTLCLCSLMLHFQIHNISERNIVICLIVISNTVTYSHEILLSRLINSASISNIYGKRILYSTCRYDKCSHFK